MRLRMATTDNRMSGPDEKSDASENQIPPIDSGSLNLPNLITLSRLILAVVLFELIYVEALWITAAVVFVLAVATDALDGYVARRYGMVTTLGRILDPFVDKIIVCGAFVFLLNKRVEFDSGVLITSGVNEWMVIIVISREMFVTSLRAFLEQHGKDFSATLSGKIKMATQCLAVTVSLLSLSPDIGTSEFANQFNLVRDVVLWAAVAVTAYSGIVYSYRAYLMLRVDSGQ